MEWQKILEGAIGASPLAILLAYISCKLWVTVKEKDAEIRRLNDQTLRMLSAVSRASDDDSTSRPGE